jgi:hypothetical protein
MLPHDEQSSLAIAWRTIVRLLLDTLKFVSLGFRARSQLAAENLFLRKQLALYAERRVRAGRADDATRIPLVVLARFVDWRAALTVVKPETDLVASQRVPPLLAVEVKGVRAPAAPGRCAAPDCHDDESERHVRSFDGATYFRRVFRPDHGRLRRPRPADHRRSLADFTVAVWWQFSGTTSPRQSRKGQIF